MPRSSPAHRTLAGAVLILLAGSATATAADYRVALALALDGRHFTAQLDDCRYSGACSYEFKAVGLRVGVSIASASDMEASVYIFGGRAGCCLLADGERFARFRPQDRIRPLPIFEGRARQRNEVVRNRLVGKLYVLIVREGGEPPPRRWWDRTIKDTSGRGPLGRFITPCG